MNSSFVMTTNNFSTSTSVNFVDIDDTALYQAILKLLNSTQLYEHQYADLLEPTKYSVITAHRLIWFFTIVTYVIAIPVMWRMIRSKTYQNIIEYFSLHIIFCAFIAWIPALILLIHHWSQKFSLTFCRLHYILLSANLTVPLCFVGYMVLERLLHVYPSFKSKLPRFSQMNTAYLYSACSWLIVIIIYALFSPLDTRDYQTSYGKISLRYCSYNYRRLRDTLIFRSIIYLIVFIPSLVAIGLVGRYFYLLRGTGQVQRMQKLWTIRVMFLVTILVFYEVAILYLEIISETYQSFILATIFNSTFYFSQILTIIFTDEYWLNLIFNRFLCCFFERRNRAAPIAMMSELEFSDAPFNPSTGHYSIVDDTLGEEFDQTTDGRQPTLRVIV